MLVILKCNSSQFQVNAHSFNLTIFNNSLLIVAVAPVAVLPNAVVSGDNLNPDVSAFVPKSSPKNEVANAVEPPTAQKHFHSSEATNPAHTGNF